MTDPFDRFGAWVMHGLALAGVGVTLFAIHTDFAPIALLIVIAALWLGAVGDTRK